MVRRQQAILALLLSSVLVSSGCNSYQKAETAYNVIKGIVQVAEADLPSLQAAGIVTANDAATISHYLTTASLLDEQYGSCIDNAQSTKLKTAGKFLACLNIFATGLSDPKELLGLRIMSASAQKRVQLYIVAVQIALNASVTALGGQTAPPPTITPATPTTSELNDLRSRVLRGL
jgi:hypothetical protein